MTTDPRSAGLLAELDAVIAVDERERGSIDRTKALLRRVDRPFDQGAQDEHVTAAAFVVSALGVVLVRHRRLGIWLQPGGHVDPGEAPRAAALREVAEETGLCGAHLDPPLLVHVDSHRGALGHVHHDCRWLLTAPPEPLAPHPGESTELGWFARDAALERCEAGLRVGLAKALDAARGRSLAEVASWPS